VQHYFFDFLGEDEDSAIAGCLYLILSLLTRTWLSLTWLSLTWFSLGFLMLGPGILGLRAWALSRLPLRLLTCSLWRLNRFLVCGA